MTVACCVNIVFTRGLVLISSLPDDKVMNFSEHHNIPLFYSPVSIVTLLLSPTPNEITTILSQFTAKSERNAQQNVHLGDL